MTGRIWKVLTRKKAIDPVTVEETRLNRVLNVFDLTALGVGSTLGVGIYVLAGQVATTAGPSVVLSFLIAAIASVFAGLCYAEFGARAPRAGSAYIYSYVCVGEFIAFVIGWNLILEYVIGSASVARGLSLYLDTLINNTLQDTFREIAPINVEFLASHFDFFSFGISILLSIGLAFGLKESSMANNIVTGLNIIVVLFIIVAGSFKADPANWHISPNNTNVTNSTSIGKGGFFPFGVESMIKGAATCFYGFVGFDCIATTAEEVKNPRKAIPVSILVSLLIIFLAYFGVSTVLTMMVPYYLQDYNAPVPRAFEMVGWEVARWIVAIGALFGLCASLFGAMFPLPRIIYAMGSDGLVFKFLAKVHPKFQTPVIGTILAGCLTGLMSALFDLSQLVNMMSIGTLQAYTIVAASVLLLRYTEEVKKVYIPIKTSSDTESVSSESSIDDKYNDDGIRHNFDGPTGDEQELIASGSSSFGRSLKYIFNFSIKEPNKVTENIVTFEVLLYCILCIGIGLCAIYLKTHIGNGEIWAIVVTSIIVGLTIMVLLSLATQPKSKKELSFKVPLLPFIPALSIMVNIYLMLMLDYRTWIRFAVWMAVGIPMYCICACTEKSPFKPQNGGNYATNITNGHSKMLNGISNPTFVHAEPINEEMKQKSPKKKLAPPPPTTIEQTENIEVLQDAVIADLEEILAKEEAISQLDDVLNNAHIGMNNARKLSAYSLSNSSAVASHSEDVVADVHCANVVIPVADPESLPLPTTLNNVKNNSELVEILDVERNSSHTVAPNNLTINDNVIEQESAGFPKKNGVDVNDETNQILQGERDYVSPKVYDRPLEKTILTSDALDKGIEAVLNITLVQHSDETKPSVSEETGDSQAISPSEPAKASNEEPIISSYVPTEEALKTVTLRHVQKQIKQIEPTGNQNATDDNLRVGTKEYTNFIKNLDNTFKRNSVLPQFHNIVPRKGVVVQPKPVIPNENVVDDPIDRVIAKETLEHLYATRNFTPSEAENLQPILHESKNNVDETLQQPRAKNDPIDTLENNDRNSDNALSSSKNTEAVSENSTTSKPDVLQNHKPKMDNAFNSISLRKLETQGEERLKRRLSKSLGSSFSKADERTDHKHKMNDIFKSINAIRKDSAKKQTNNENII